MKWIRKVASTPLESVAKVIDSISESIGDRQNAPSIHAVREAINGQSLTLFPVGAIYMSVTDVNPGEIFGGTWTQIKDTFLLACGDTYANASTGGRAETRLGVADLPSHTHTYVKATGVGNTALTVNQIPSHTHSVTGTASPASGKNVTLNSNAIDAAAGTGSTPSKSIENTTSLSVSGTAAATGGGQAHGHTLGTATIATSATGGGQGFTNMPPYLAVYVWKRVA